LKTFILFNLSSKNKLLAIGLSARVMVTMARQTGWTVVAIDVFGDVDTCDGAAEVYRVRSLSVFDLQPVVDQAIRNHGLTHCLYASGFEAHIDSLRYLSDRLVVLGNSPADLARVCESQAFFKALTGLSVAFPDTRFTAPKQGRWLCKSAYSAGGMGISWFVPRQTPLLDSVYWQRPLDGDVVSATFIAHAEGVDVIGFNRQFSASLAGRPFVFAGLMSNIQQSSGLKQVVERDLRALVAHFDLRGLGSFDFIVQEDRYFALEINARISASSALYGHDLLRAHVAACSGCYDGCEIDEQPRACRVVFADRDMAVSNGLSWPDCVVDRPADGVP
jgi:predicted ATP-grasp superfamily ATP-dependent carboligase